MKNLLWILPVDISARSLQLEAIVRAVLKTLYTRKKIFKMSVSQNCVQHLDWFCPEQGRAVRVEPWQKFFFAFPSKCFTTFSNKTSPYHAWREISALASLLGLKPESIIFLTWCTLIVVSCLEPVAHSPGGSSGRIVPVAVHVSVPVVSVGQHTKAVAGVQDSVTAFIRYAYYPNILILWLLAQHLSIWGENLSYIRWG